MMAKQLFFTLAAILAHSASSQPIQPCLAPQPYFTVNDFTIFTPTNGNIEPGRLSFYIGKNVECSSDTVLNPHVPHTCTDASYDYTWDGKSLTVREMFTPCANV